MGWGPRLGPILIETHVPPITIQGRIVSEEKQFCFVFSEIKNCFFANKDLCLVDIILHPREFDMLTTHGIQTYFKPLSCLTMFDIYREAGTHLKMEKG